MFSATTTLVLDGLAAFQRDLPRKVGGAIKATALAIEVRAQEASKVDTGAQSVSVGAVSTASVGLNDYDDHLNAASELNPKAGFLPAPDVPDGPGVLAAAAVQCAVDYGIANDRGTATKAGDGWFTKAAEQARDEFPQRVAQALREA